MLKNIPVASGLAVSPAPRKNSQKILAARGKKTFTQQMIITILRTSVLIHLWQFL